jgi:single-stranded-DNA-specific exonuclease
MPKKYEVKEAPREAELGLEAFDTLTRTLLWNRGIKNKKEADTFLNPDFDTQMHDPFLLLDMELAADRICSAIEKCEKIGIWSDYDADGIPGGALLHDFFRLIGFENFINYIPDRHNEGYGLNMEGIDELCAAGVKLMITVDCGIRDSDKIAHANKLGMEVIVTDHHEPAPEMPPAFAIINHKRIDSKYPEQVLCGSGVVWKLCEAILIKKRSLEVGDKPFDLAQGKEKWLLDLAGIATLSDMVPLTGENRVIAHFGLKVLRKTKRPGLLKLYSMLKMNKDSLTEDDIAFMITPRINAASRMGKPRDAFDLLTTLDLGQGEAMALHLNGINNERKGVVAGIVKEAKHHIKVNLENKGEQSVIVVGNPSWRPSLLGLAANSIAEEYRRPVFMWGRGGEGEIKGSCRSDGQTDLVALMERAKFSFIEFGGHKFSGGFSVDDEKIHTLEDALIAASLGAVMAEEKYYADAELKIKDVNYGTADLISRLAPFGIGNAKPLFIFHNVIAEKVSRFGKGKEHLEVVLRDGGHTARAIGFFTTPETWGEALFQGRNTNLVASIEKSSFAGRNEVRLRIVDFF